ncbi:MAG: efflux RND transporter periplasmic adaptor subunit [Kofleriaceae bacterium]|nr:MAG: efflux RND transporter periplasmic adaptor subunit [Kofleriaceae bacterium]MBZ0236938.1 efflux RND transporter periplasmic adaptor subunit [Kofleriaceae bacterium]
MKKMIVLLAVALLACGEKARQEEHPADHAAAKPSADHSAHGGLPEGHAEVEIPSDRQQVIGLKLAPAERTRFDATVRASATVQADEKREAHVHSKLMGYVRKLHVNAVGQKVKKGQALYSIYSQELLVAQQEYLRAKKFSTDLADAARERLRLWDIPEDQIRAIEETGTPVEAIVVRAPISGTVIEKSIVQGHFVEPDMMLYLIADLSQVWVIAEVYEYELGRVDRKGTATIQIEGLADPITAKIDYVYPTVDQQSRTVKVRMVVENKKGLLRPGNFATVELPGAGGELLTVPDEAVIDTGFRRVVYVASGEGRFRPVEVEVGRRVGGRAEIRKGISEGDQVVVSAQFLVDSESRLRATGPGPGHGGH